jgi:hypothetical protein
MAMPAYDDAPNISRLALRTAATIAWITVALGGCSINLGSLTPTADKEEPARLTSSSNIASLSETCLCRARHRQVYADCRTMPSTVILGRQESDMWPNLSA